MDTGWRGPSANDSSRVCLVGYGGGVGYDSNGYDHYSARPVVSIPRSEVDMTVTEDNSTTTLSLSKVTQ